MLPSPLDIERSQVQPEPLSRFFKQVVRHLKIKLMMITSSKLSSSTVFSPLKWWNRPLLVRPGFKWMWCNKAFHIYMDFNQFWPTLRRWYLRPTKIFKIESKLLFFDKMVEIGFTKFYKGFRIHKNLVNQNIDLIDHAKNIMISPAWLEQIVRLL